VISGLRALFLVITGVIAFSVRKRSDLVNDLQHAPALQHIPYQTPYMQ